MHAASGDGSRETGAHAILKAAASQKLLQG